MSNATATRLWEWTPSPVSNAFVSTLLRIPILHRVLSGQILLLTFTGRKSGKRYMTPVGYMREGQTVIVLTKWFRAWWRNFQKPAPVDVLIGRKNYHGTAKAITDEVAIVPLIADMIRKYPYQGGIYGVRMISANEPDMDDVRQIASKLVALQITLKE
jgi:deazaflavin-dependent oxidoreductase (nitroreductase family)